ncbi:MAG: hypothetical protein KAT30_08250 [Candidatus Krumholzibacteria bacterium]|nr:hypothetical protein [Candidatus Krumholzibacteria bacterium]
MNKRIFAALVVCICLIMTATAGLADIKTLFPQMDGWEPEGDPEVYGAGNLFEYINGSADLYLDYNFQEMDILNYFDDYGRTVLVEVYDQGNLNNAYGMYSQEKPRPANLVEIGAEGYYDTGVLNFFRGSYYVKIQGFDLEESDEAMLTIVAKIVSQNIGGKKDLPPVLDCFPPDAMVRNSERFIAKNLFGHGFLHSAFTADYRSDQSQNTRGFIIAAKDTADADAMLAAYVKLVEDNGGAVQDQNGVLQFTDPVSRAAGTMTVKKNGGFLWGLSIDIPETGAAFVTGVEKNLRTMKLIK